jgi:hypothetical protein
MAGSGLMRPANAQEIAELPMAPTPQVSATQSAPAPSLTEAIHFRGGITVEPAAQGALPLSLDDAISRGLKFNLQVQLANQTERSVHGQVSAVLYYLLPNMKASGYTSTQEIDLAALGFKPSSLAAFGFAPGMINTIVKVNTTDVQLSADQVLFNLPDFYLYAAAKRRAT